MMYSLYLILLMIAVIGCQKDPVDPVFVGDVTLTTQQEVDEFSRKNYEEIEGNLIINSHGESDATKITSISGLSSLRKITVE